MLDAIAKPFGWLMMGLYELTGNFGVATILFSLCVTLVLLPFMAKSKKSMMRMSRLTPRMQELQRKHEGNQQKLNEEMARLYREEKVNPMSGCLWSLLPFPILLALYRAVVKPLTIMMGVDSALLASGGAIANKLTELGYAMSNYTSSGNSFYEEIYKAKFISDHWSDFAGLSDKLVQMDYNFLGLDLSATPNWKFWTFDLSAGAWAVIGLFLIPIISTGLSYLSIYISQKMNPTMGNMNAQQQSTNKTMLLIMPLMSLWIGFVMPAAMGLYWIMNSVLGVIRDVVLTGIFKKQLDKADAERIERERAREEELERKRQETERLRAMNATNVNRNTSKKKQQAQQKQQDTERRAAVEREERAARRERLGVTEPEKPASQVGNRRYARGRAYVEDRFVNPEAAEEATRAAAAESEFGESIDTEVAEEEVVETAAPAAGRPWFWRWSPPRRWAATRWFSPVRRLSHRRWHGRLWRRRPFGRLSSIAPLWRFPSIRRLPHRRRFQPWRRCRPSPLSSFTVPRLRAGAFLEKEATSLCLNLPLSLVPAPASGPSSRVSFLPAVIT